VLKIDKENERFSLGIKQMEPDPWQVAAEKLRIGTKVKGKITNITDFGLFVELSKGIEGLVHISEIGDEAMETPVGHFTVGDPIEVIVISFSPDDKKIGLSIKSLSKSAEERATESAKQEETAPSTFGDILKAAAKGKQEGNNGDTA